jgi:hypothetical protein
MHKYATTQEAWKLIDGIKTGRVPPGFFVRLCLKSNKAGSLRVFHGFPAMFLWN